MTRPTQTRDEQKKVTDKHRTNKLDNTEVSNTTNTIVSKKFGHRPGRFLPGESGFESYSHSDTTKTKPSFWRKFFLNKETNPAVLKKYIRECIEFFDLPKRWRPTHVELLEALRLKHCWEREIPKSNFEYLEESSLKLDGKPSAALFAPMRPATPDNTIIILPSGPAPEKFKVIDVPSPQAIDAPQHDEKDNKNDDNGNENAD